MKSKIDKSKSEFWDSDCFYQKELERIWSTSEYKHEPDEKEPVYPGEGR